MGYKEYKIDSYHVITNSDLNEGRGRDVLLARFLDRPEAEKFAIGKGVFGTNADVKHKIEHIVIYDTVEDYDKFYHEEEKRAALAKLTARERTILGLE